MTVGSVYSLEADKELSSDDREDILRLENSIVDRITVFTMSSRDKGRGTGTGTAERTDSSRGDAKHMEHSIGARIKNSIWVLSKKSVRVPSTRHSYNTW